VRFPEKRARVSQAYPNGKSRASAYLCRCTIIEYFESIERYYLSESASRENGFGNGRLEDKHFRALILEERDILLNHSEL